MEIITQTFISFILDTFLKEWRAETMIALIVFLLTFYLMRKRVEHYKILSELYMRDVIKATQTLKECHEAFVEIKSILDTVPIGIQFLLQ